MTKITKILLTLLIPALLTGNYLIWQNLTLGTILAGIYLTYLSYSIGQLFLKQTDGNCLRCLLGFLVSISYIAILGSAFFYLWQLGNAQILIITWLLPILLSIKFLKHGPNNNPSKNRRKSQEPWPLQLSHYTLIALYVLATLKTLILLSQKLMAEAIRSPWEIIASEFFITYAALTVILLIIFIQSKKFKPDSPAVYLGLSSIHLFLTYSITLFVYQLNFGFDPFIHQASEKLLALTGTISPKPLLYIGHYAIVNWTSAMSGLNIVVVDRLLVPILTALLLPPAFYFSFTQGLGTKARSTLMAMLALPYLLIPFYFSVPQNLSNLILLITILLTSLYLFSKQLPLWLLWLLGITTITIHPFSGIPLIVFLAIITLLRQTKISLNRHQKLISLIILIIIGTALLPIALTIGGDINNTNIRLNEIEAAEQTLTIAGWVPFYSIYHLVYLIETNHTIVLALLAAGGLWLLFKRKQTLYLSSTVFLFLILSIDVSLLELLKLPIINYELPEFINRFWQIGLLFISPLIFAAIIHLINKIIGEGRTEENILEKTLMSNNNKRLRAFSLSPYRTINHLTVLFFISLLATVGLYLSYPRVDGFTKSRAFATSQHDIAAAQWIDQDANNANYVVLANQAVAAAALHEYGFKKYYTTDQGQLFYYPIPTTSPLYELYLDMVYIAPLKKRLQQAMDITNSDIGYFVINDYWLDYEKIVEQAKNEFEEYEVINDGKLTIFKLPSGF